MNLMRLDQISKKSTVKVERIDGGWGVRQRLSQLGVRVGCHMMVKRGSTFRGPLLISISDTNVALGRGMASKVWVQVDSNGKK